MKIRRDTESTNGMWIPGKKYLDFTGGVVWPFLNQGALVVL